VCFLQRTEKDPWKCFLIGISAPALVTTATAAKAATLDGTVAELASVTRTVSVSDYGESIFHQFVRGFVGSNPTITVLVVGQNPNLKNEKLLAARATLALGCNRADMPMAFKPRSWRPDLSPLVFALRQERAFLATVSWSGPATKVISGRQTEFI